MDEIPFEERRVIRELVGFWRTDEVPHDLSKHIAVLGPWEGTNFFRQVYEDLRTGQRSKYAASSVSEFKRFLEAEYRRLDQEYTERRTQAAAKALAWQQASAEVYAELQAEAIAERQIRIRAKEQAEMETQARADILRQDRAKADAERQARADFEAFDEEMAKATIPAGLTPHTDVFSVYKNHCWHCKNDISSDVNAQCPDCRGYICGFCSSCMCEYDQHWTPLF